MDKSSKNKNNNKVNQKIISEFERLIEQIKSDINNAPSKEESMTHHFRLRNISAVLNILKKYPKEIKSGEQLKDIKGVGKGSIERINEILKTGYLKEIKVKPRDKKILEQMKELEQIHGIGEKKALELIRKYKITNIKELKEAYEAGKLEKIRSISLGLKYYGIYKREIPRKEIDEIKKYIKPIIKSVDSKLKYEICGSYRRLKPESNDIDILLVHPNVKTKKDIENKVNYLRLVVEKLKEKGFILDDIDLDYEVKYMGFTKYKDNPIRRLDIMYYPHNSYPTALLHLTGSGDFNRKMRELAKDLGYLLNQFGLYKKDKNKTVRIPINSEKDVFTAIGMEYVEPQYRI